MKSNRISIPLATLATRDDAEAVMRDLAIAVNSQRKILADRDAAILAINKRIEAPLAELDTLIQRHTDSLRAWSEANPDQFPKDRKSLRLLSGTIGFRTGTPKLALLSRAFTWQKVLDLLERTWPGMIRLKKEPDKEGILAFHSQHDNQAEAAAELKRYGLRVAHDETFFVEPDLTQFETRQTEAA